MRVEGRVWEQSQQSLPKVAAHENSLNLTLKYVNFCIFWIIQDRVLHSCTIIVYEVQTPIPSSSLRPWPLASFISLSCWLALLLFSMPPAYTHIPHKSWWQQRVVSDVRIHWSISSLCHEFNNTNLFTCLLLYLEHLFCLLCVVTSAVNGVVETKLQLAMSTCRL